MARWKSSKKTGDRFQLLLVVEMVFLLALVPGCFRRERLICSFDGAGILGSVERAEDYGRFCSEKMELVPGVYQVRIWTSLAKDQYMQVYMDCDRADRGALRCNVVPVFAGNDHQDFEVYVSGRVSTAYVQCEFFGTDLEGLERLEIWETAMGCRKLLVTAVAVLAVVDLLVMFRRRILAGKVTKKQQIVFWGLAAGVLVAYLPCLTDHIIGGDDVFFHLSRISYLADALKQGAPLPVRIEGTWLYGHGYMSPTFYGDLFLYIPALLQLAGFSVMGSYKIFLLLVTAATAYIAWHSFQKCVKNEYAALFGSLVYLLSPYRLYNVYGRAAVGEFLAMAFLPLVCCGAYLLYAEDPASKGYQKYKWYVVWGMSGVLQSHLITTEMAALLLVMCCVLFCRKTFRRHTFCQLLEATGLVLLINAWFWLPMLYMLGCDTYQIQQITEADMQSTGLLFGNFFYWLPYAGERYTAKNEVWVGIGAVLLLLFYGAWRFGKKKKDAACDVAALFGVLALVMSTAYFPWNLIMKIPVAGYIAASLQFPWRWMSPANLFLALLAALLFRNVERDGGTLARAGIGIAAAVIVLSAVYHVDSIVCEMPPVYLYNEDNMGTVNVGGREYMLSETEITKLRYHKPTAEEGLLWSDYEKVGTDVTIALENQTQEVRYIEIPLTGYRGYGIEASGAGEEVPFLSDERGAHGDLRLAVPARYQGTVRISYQGFALFRAAEALSLGSLAAVAAAAFCRKRKQRERDAKSI
ncbi:MAG: hypothetical protein NC305_07890 [Lachnospiraceae bacterium]|nr:hypothetical protein [Butyrivibrio sp.]MCM1342825.1 hypothetical protein [Muribaculaceae bacterium]MCM1410452.1 hypothetical protein [Lachnospiraceae bacterium]